jgi:membrane-associated phospholipid phosphatase
MAITRYLTTIIISVTLLFAHAATSQVEQNGNTIQLLIPGSAFMSTFIIKQPHDKGWYQFIQAFAVTTIITESLKIITHKRRPNGGCCKSFPSGHTSASFMGASFIHKRYGLKYAIIPYLGATYVGFSRIYAHKHYTEDVICGAIIGIVTSFYFTKPYHHVTITPILNHKKIGLNLNAQW